MADDRDPEPRATPGDQDLTSDDDVGPVADVAGVRRANHRFYAAFEARDLDAMSDLWVHGDEVACTHPGWETLHGWAQVASSWMGLFDTDIPLQIIVTNERVRVDGDLAWVTLDENLLDNDANHVSGNTVAAVNVFRRVEGHWRMVLHHGSSVAGVTPLNWQEL